MSKPSNPAVSFSDRQWLGLVEAAIRRWGELALEELQRDVAKLDSLPGFEQTYISTYWRHVVDSILEPGSRKLPVPCVSIEDLEKQSEFIERYFGISLDPNRADPVLKKDVANRLSVLKENLAREFELSVIDTIAAHEISSPIEQIFLMEWRFARVEERFRLQLRPHQPIRTDVGSFFLDFCITAIDNPATRFSVAIELDGHEFHEKTAEQVRQDKRRERAIIRAGVPNGLAVLRFSGSEIFRDCKACIREIIEDIEQLSLS